MTFADCTVSSGQALQMRRRSPTVHADWISCLTARPRDTHPRKNNQGMNARDIRRAVERVLDCYLSVETFSLHAMPYDPDSAGHGGSIPQAERRTRLWKSTVAIQLRKLEREDESLLLWVAERRRDLAAGRSKVLRLSQIISSPTAMQRCACSQVALRRDIGRAWFQGLVATYLRRVTDSPRYGEACTNFWLTVTESESRDVRHEVFEMIDELWPKRAVS